MKFNSPQQQRWDLADGSPPELRHWRGISLWRCIDDGVQQLHVEGHYAVLLRADAYHAPGERVRVVVGKRAAREMCLGALVGVCSGFEVWELHDITYTHSRIAQGGR